MSLVPLKNVTIGSIVECYGQLARVGYTTLGYVELISLQNFIRLSVPEDHLVKVIKKYDWRKHSRLYKNLLK